MLKIKVCGLRNRENIREIITAGPDYVGFIFYPQSKRFVGGRLDERLLRAIPPFINKVGVFVDEEIEKILDMVTRYNLNMVQLHGNEPADYCAELTRKRIPVIKSFNIGDDFNFSTLEAYQTFTEYFLFDRKSDVPGGSGLKFNWTVLEKYTLKKMFFLSGGIKPEDAEAINNLNFPALYAVDINSGFEIEPGIKDSIKVTDFIKALKANKI